MKKAQIQQFIQSFHKSIADVDLFTWLTVPTLFVVYFNFGARPFIAEVILIFFAISFLWTQSTRWPVFWVMLATFLSIDMYLSWVTAANHGWVMWYWVVALMVASFFTKKEDQQFIITTNARWLLIIVMLVAVGWKVVNPYYMDGSFFERNLVSNPLMTTFTHTVTGLPWQQIEENYMAMNNLFTSPDVTERDFNSNENAHVLGVVISWWVLIVEFLIGFLLLFRRYYTDLAAHIMMIWFIVAAYLGAPVLGFGLILTVLGMAVTGERFVFLRPYYAVLFLILLLYALPWFDILFNISGIYPLV